MPTSLTPFWTPPYRRASTCSWSTGSTRAKSCGSCTYVRHTLAGCFASHNPIVLFSKRDLKLLSRLAAPHLSTHNSLTPTSQPDHQTDPRRRLWRLIGIAVGADLSHGLIENLCQLAAINPLEIDSDLLQLEAPPGSRTRRAQKDVMDYVQAIARVKESEAFKTADDGRTPMIVVLLQKRTL